MTLRAATAVSRPDADPDRTSAATVAALSAVAVAVATAPRRASSSRISGTPSADAPGTTSGSRRSSASPTGPGRPASRCPAGTTARTGSSHRIRSRSPGAGRTTNAGSTASATPSSRKRRSTSGWGSSRTANRTRDRRGEPAQGAGEEGGPDAGRGEQGDAALVQAARGADRRAGRPDRGEDVAGTLGEDLTGGGDAGGAAAAVDQGDAQLPLERRDVRADPRLRPVDLLGGRREAPAVQHREEGPQPVEFHSRIVPGSGNRGTDERPEDYPRVLRGTPVVVHDLGTGPRGAVSGYPRNGWFLPPDALERGPGPCFLDALPITQRGGVRFALPAAGGGGTGMAGNSTESGRSVTSKITSILMTFTREVRTRSPRSPDWPGCRSRPRTGSPPSWRRGGCWSAPTRATTASACRCA